MRPGPTRWRVIFAPLAVNPLPAVCLHSIAFFGKHSPATQMSPGRELMHRPPTTGPGRPTNRRQIRGRDRDAPSRRTARARCWSGGSSSSTTGRSRHRGRHRRRQQSGAPGALHPRRGHPQMQSTGRLVANWPGMLERAWKSRPSEAKPPDGGDGGLEPLRTSPPLECRRYRRSSSRPASPRRPRGR